MFDYRWKLCRYPEGTTAQGYAMIIWIQKETETDEKEDDRRD